MNPYLLVTMKDGSEIVIELERSPWLCAFLSVYKKRSVLMNEKRFRVIDDDFSKWIVDTTLTEDRHEGAIYTAYDMCRKLNELYEENERLKKQIQIYEQLISNSYIGEEETLDGFVGKYVIWEDELQKYKEKIKKVIDDE